jgi:uncharacterized protein YdeI (YjbR/CyaY-like superfamily)
LVATRIPKSWGTKGRIEPSDLSWIVFITLDGVWHAALMATEPPELLLPDATAWRSWLAEHGGEDAGVWLVLAKKGTSDPTSQGRRRDEATSLRRFTPRRRRSSWSKRNVGLVERLTAEGRMQPRGLAEVDRAKADGRWDAAYAGPASIEVPPDLTAALAADPAAQAMFDCLTSQNRFAVLHRIQDAKRPETRTKRIAQYVGMLARGETIYPQKPRGGA